MREIWYGLLCIGGIGPIKCDGSKPKILALNSFCDGTWKNLYYNKKHKMKTKLILVFKKLNTIQLEEIKKKNVHKKYVE